MTETAQLRLPLVQAAQAQKHVTVNEALARLDGLVLLALQSRGLAAPPLVAAESACYGVPIGAVNEWSGMDGQLAIRRNGGWDFLPPQRGWRALIMDEGVHAVHDGGDWRAGFLTLSPKNAGMAAKVIEFDHTIASGVQSTTSQMIPPNSLVVGVTGRVVSGITGTLASWQLGNPGAVGRFGAGLGTGLNAFVHGLLGQPTAYYAAAPLQLDATGGSFSGGVVRLAVHYLDMSLPDL